jgi:hypothetical protein
MGRRCLRSDRFKVAAGYIERQEEFAANITMAAMPSRTLSFQWR